MSKWKALIDKIAKLIEEGVVTSKDFGDEIRNIFQFKREEMIKKFNFISKDEFEVQKARLDKIENKLNDLTKKKKTKQAKKS